MTDSGGPQRVLKIGTRGSQLATSQAGHVRDALVAAGFPAELHIVRTEGDVVMAPVERIGVGVFVHALRDALHRGECDVAVHSHKDLPTAEDDRFSPITVPERVPSEDALIARDGLRLEALPEGAKVGTSAPRRRSQLHAVRPDLDLYPIRGNIDTRMGYVTSGELDAVVLAAAGLHRTGRLDSATQRFTPEEMLPSPAQGALAVECRVDDIGAAQAVATIDHLVSRLRVVAERRMLQVLEAGCTAPVGAVAELEDGTLTLHAVTASFDGGTVLRETASAALPEGWRHPDAGPEAVEAARALGQQVAAALLDRGAADLMSTGEHDGRDPLVPTETTTAPPTRLPPDETPPTA